MTKGNRKSVCLLLVDTLLSFPYLLPKRGTTSLRLKYGPSVFSCRGVVQLWSRQDLPKSLLHTVVLSSDLYIYPLDMILLCIILYLSLLQDSAEIPLLFLNLFCLFIFLPTQYYPRLGQRKVKELQSYGSFIL